LQDPATITSANDANPQDHQGDHVKLFRNVKNSTRWFAFGRTFGWVVFPAEISPEGKKREDARGICLADMREVQFAWDSILESPALGNASARLRDAA
jgi:hypothetical protein